MSRAASDLSERGFTVLEHTHDEAAIEVFRRAVLELHAAHGAPAPFADPPRTLSSEVVVNPTGFAIFQLVKLRPEVAAHLVSPALAAAAREVLGDDCQLELTGASLSDERRRFFTWHHHIGGIDVEEVRPQLLAGTFAPRFTRPERLIAVTYLDDVDADGGELLTIPRRIDDPLSPLGDERDPEWPGAVPVRVPRRSTVVFEQCTWHAVRPQRRSGPRIFVGCYLVSRTAARTRAVDASLRGFAGGDALFRSLLPDREPA